MSEFAEELPVVNSVCRWLSVLSALVNIVFGAFLGGLASALGGVAAGYRGGLLAAGIVMAYVVGDFASRRLSLTWPQLAVSALLGAVFGLVASVGIVALGLVAPFVEFNTVQTGMSVFWICAAYGMATNFAFRLALIKGYGGLRRFLLVFLAVFAVHLFRFGWMGASDMLWWYLSAVNSLPFAVAVILPMQLYGLLERRD